MFGFGGLNELFFILLLALLIFGPEKLPEIGRMLAKGMAEVRKASNELKRTLNAELAATEQEQAARRNLQAVPAPAGAGAGAGAEGEPFQASDPASSEPVMPPRWPVASTIPAIEPFPAAPPAALPPTSSAAVVDAGGAATPDAGVLRGAPAADADGSVGPAAEPAWVAEAGLAAGAVPASPTATPSPLLAPYGEGPASDRPDRPDRSDRSDGGDSEAAHVAPAADAAPAAVTPEPR